MHLVAEHSATPAPAHEERRRLRFQLARLLRASELMLAGARQGDWEEVEALERERRPELDACFASALDIDASAEVTEAIAALMHINEQLLKLVAEARGEALAGHRSLGHRRQAALAYRHSGEGA